MDSRDLARYTRITRAAKRADESVAPLQFCIGMSVHFGFNGDRYPGQVIEISKTGHTIKVLKFEPVNFRDRSNGPTEGNRDCDFEPAPASNLAVFTRRKNGRYYQVGSRYYGLGHGMCYAQNPCI